MKNPHVDKYCNQLGASVFSGDFLFTRSDLIKFEEYLDRWKREVESYKTMNYYDTNGQLCNPEGTRSIFDDVDE